MAIVSLVRAVGTRPAVRPGSSTWIAVGAGAISPAGSGSAEGARRAAFGVLTESAPGRAGTDPANAGPGVIVTRAGADVTRGVTAVGVLMDPDPPAGWLTFGCGGGSDGLAGASTSASDAGAAGIKDAKGVAVTMKWAPATSAAAVPSSRSGRPFIRRERRAVGRAFGSSVVSASRHGSAGGRGSSDLYGSGARATGGGTTVAAGATGGAGFTVHGRGSTGVCTTGV